MADPLVLERLDRRFRQEDESRATAVRRASEDRYGAAIREASGPSSTVYVLLTLLALSTLVNVIAVTVAVAATVEISDVE